MHPSISVVMGVHNGMPWLPAAVESVCQQTVRDFEFIIVDDASTDETAVFLASAATADSRIRVVRNPSNIGLTQSLNVALGEARGDWIARQDADDVWLPGRLERQVAFLQRNREIQLLGAMAEVVNADSRPRLSGQRGSPLSHEALRWHLLFANPFVHASVMFSRRLGGQPVRYNDSVRYAQDYELWVRMAVCCRMTILGEVLVLRRIHERSIGCEHRIEQEDAAHAISDRAIEVVAPGLLEQYEKAMLRRWFRDFPDLLGDDGLTLAVKSLDLIRVVARQNGVSYKQLLPIRLSWSTNILGALPDYRWRMAWRVGLMNKLIGCTPGLVIRDAAQRVARRGRAKK